jgi:ABC-type transport system substrate-binding protein
VAEIAISTSDLETRKEAYFEMQEILFEDLPHFNVTDQVAYQPSWSCVMMPFWEQELFEAEAPSNYYQGLLYAWIVEEKC